MIKTYLVPITEEMVKAMESGEAPSFLHCATCLDGLTNGEVLMEMFPQMKLIRCDSSVNMQDDNMQYGASFPVDWWNRKWGG